MSRFALLVGGEDFVVRDDLGVSPPTSTRLLQGYPNPFTSASVIRYEVAKPDVVRIRVFDVQGRQVKTLLVSQTEPGRYEVAWCGRDETGRPVPAGVYFCRLEVQGIADTRKIIRTQ
jgi:hypothetical protein